MFVKMKQFIITDFAQSLLYHLTRLYSKTFRFRVENENTWLKYYSEKNGTVLLCAYHQQFFSAIRHFKKYEVYHPGLMISKSRDGEIVAGVAKLTGWHPVRGSSSKGGREALKLMVGHLKEYRLSAHIVDGPRGPAGIIKPGAIRLAYEADAVIVPFYIAADRAWYFDSWDRFLLPKPFANVVLRFGDMIRLEADEDQHEFEHQRKFLEDRMRRELAELKMSLNQNAR
ncbi:MAG: hypothetical protein B6245_09940 [Desulfobacteraceae bacterium 4572_88]|nr:MAG: hypothetical protein B6245_09940 [Desulfobacteraceae bacterium 4572_88]